MTKRKKTPRPTDAELNILRVLWQRGPSTVREVRDVLNRSKPTGYTTALKFMQIMNDKGLLTRDESRRTHVYRTQRPAEKIQRQLVGYLLERAFEGSAQKLVMHALSAKKVSPEELAEIRAMLDEIEKRGAMSVLENILAAPLVYRFGYALLQFFWQGLLIAAVVAVAMRLLRARSANTRYLAGWLGLLAMAICVSLTTWLTPAPPPRPVAESPTAAITPANMALEPGGPDAIPAVATTPPVASGQVHKYGVGALGMRNLIWGNQGTTGALGGLTVGLRG